MDKRQFQDFAWALHAYTSWKVVSDDGRIISREDFIKQLKSFDGELAAKALAFFEAGDAVRQHVASRAGSEVA
jgi:hypothetical protein